MRAGKEPQGNKALITNGDDLTIRKLKILLKGQVLFKYDLCQCLHHTFWNWDWIDFKDIGFQSVQNVMFLKCIPEVM